MSNQPRRTVYMNPAEWAALDRVAQGHKCTASQLTRQIVRQWLAGQELLPDIPQRGERKSNV